MFPSFQINAGLSNDLLQTKILRNTWQSIGASLMRWGKVCLLEMGGGGEVMNYGENKLW